MFEIQIYWLGRTARPEKAKITKRTQFLISRCLASFMRGSFGKTYSFVAIEREEESKKIKMLIIAKQTQFPVFLGEYRMPYFTSSIFLDTTASPATSR